MRGGWLHFWAGAKAAVKHFTTSSAHHKPATSPPGDKSENAEPQRAKSCQAFWFSSLEAPFLLLSGTNPEEN